MLDANVRGENVSGATVGAPVGHTLQSQRALELHDAMVRVDRQFIDGSPLHGEVLSVFKPLLNEGVIPWPQLQALKDHIEQMKPDYPLDARQREEQLALTNDLAIWIVETYYRPVSPFQVAQLKLEFQKAGLGYVLYRCFERHRHWLDQQEHRSFQMLFEEWINEIWDGLIELPLPKGIRTVGHLIAWLAEATEGIPRCIAPIIEELQESET